MNSKKKPYIHPNQVNPHMKKDNSMSFDEYYRHCLDAGVLSGVEKEEAYKAWSAYVTRYQMEYIVDEKETTKPKVDKMIPTHYTDPQELFEEVKCSIPRLYLIKHKENIS